MSMPASNAVAYAASGFCTANTRGWPLTCTCAPSNASERIGLTPPTVLRNWLGGFTWNGRTASARV